MFEFGIRDQGQLVTVLTEAESQFAQHPESVEPSVRFALQAQLGAGADPSSMIRAMAKFASAYPERAGDMTAIGDLLFRAYKAIGVGALGEFTEATPEVLTSGAAAGISPEDVLTAHILMTRGAGSGQEAATRVQAGLVALLGKGPESRKFMREYGLAGLPLQARLARLGELTAGMNPEERAEFLYPYLPDIRGAKGVQVAIANLADWDLVQGQLAPGGVTIGQQAEAARRLGSFAEDKVAAGLLAAENIRGEGDQSAGLGALKDLYRARGVPATPAGWMGTLEAVRTWALHPAGLVGLRPFFGATGEAEVRGQTMERLGGELGEAGVKIEHHGPIINYGVKSLYDNLRRNFPRPAAAIKG